MDLIVPFFWYCFSIAIHWSPIASLSTNKTRLRWRRTAGPSLSGAVWRKWASWCVRHWRTWSSCRAGISPPSARSAAYGPKKEVLTPETRLIYGYMYMYYSYMIIYKCTILGKIISHLNNSRIFFVMKFLIYLEKFINIFILFRQR